MARGLLVEDRHWDRVLAPRGRVENRIVGSSELAVHVMGGSFFSSGMSEEEKSKVTHSRAMGSPMSAWPFIQSAPRSNLAAVSAMQERRRSSASVKPNARCSVTKAR
jgi:hypothetical protein